LDIQRLSIDSSVQNDTDYELDYFVTTHNHRI